MERKLKKIILTITSSIALLFLVACSKTERYEGECFNQTANAGAEIVLEIEEFLFGEVTGRLVILGEDLSGGGAIKGKINGDNISFTSPEGDMHYPIQWVGVKKGNEIEGIYVVEPKSSEYVKQQGYWKVKKILEYTKELEGNKE